MAVETRTLAWQELNYMQALDVVRSAETLVASAGGEAGPWLAVMHFQLEMQGVQPVIHMAAGEGRLTRCLRSEGRLALLFRAEHCTGVDTVLAEGTAELTTTDGGVLLRVPVEEMSARRWFLS